MYPDIYSGMYPGIYSDMYPGIYSGMYPGMYPGMTNVIRLGTRVSQSITSVIQLSFRRSLYACQVFWGSTDSEISMAGEPFRFFFSLKKTIVGFYPCVTPRTNASQGKPCMYTLPKHAFEYNPSWKTGHGEEAHKRRGSGGTGGGPNACSQGRLLGAGDAKNEHRLLLLPVPVFPYDIYIRSIYS